VHMVKIIVGIVHNDIQEVCRSCRIVTALGGCAGALLTSYPGSLGEGEKRAWYLLFRMCLII